MATPEAVLDFWFGAPGSADAGQSRDWWFRKSEATDRRVRDRFGAALGPARDGVFDAWTATPRGTLALILLLDQFSRNVHRDSPLAFAGDAHALALAQALVAQGSDRRLAPLERWFAYLPFEHAESLAAQDESVRLFTALAADGLAGPLPWAGKHRDVIRRFGRFPHRNAVLGRTTTPEEAAYLAEHGGF